MRVYLSFSKQADYLNKSGVFNLIGSVDRRIEPNAYWGGTYDQSVLDNMDMILCIPPDEHTRNDPTHTVSKGVYSEAVYGMENDIPVYSLAEVAPLTCNINILPTDLLFAEVYDYTLRGNSWKTDYGKLWVENKQTINLAELLGRFLSSESHNCDTSEELNLGAAKLLNLI